MAESMDLDDAIASMKESGSVPDGFLFRIIVEEGSDLQPFGTSVYGLTVTHELELNRAKAEKEGTVYDIFDVIGFEPIDSMASLMKKVDTLLSQIVKQSQEEGFIKGVSLAVHFINRPPEDAGWGSPSGSLPDNDSEDDDLF